ncbi:MAG: hypothetical protein IPM54_00875 [Polyangiaceae bacterium]|nr:hypothetical protein [Polyangiaceae bacterium]
MRTFTLLFISALVFATASTAFGQGVCTCEFTSGDPLGYSKNPVPTNVKLFVAAGMDRSIPSLSKVVDGVSEPVPFHFEDAPEGTGDGWLVPDAPLEPMTSYEYTYRWKDYPTRMTTGAGEDTTAPTFTTAEIVPRGLIGECIPHISAILLKEGASDDVAEPFSLTWRATIKSPAKTIYFPPLAWGYIGRMNKGEWAEDSCLNNFLEAELGKQYEATLVAFDWAGNVSREVSTSFEFADSESSDCGCRMADSSKSIEMRAFFLGALALLAYRRRRRP